MSAAKALAALGLSAAQAKDAGNLAFAVQSMAQLYNVASSGAGQMASQVAGGSRGFRGLAAAGASPMPSGTSVGGIAMGVAKTHAPLPSNAMLSVMGFTPLVRVLPKVVRLLEEWGDKLLSSRRTLMRYNAQIAGAFMQSERRGITRRIESGARTSDATADLALALDDLRDTVQPLRDAFTAASSKVLSGVIQSTNTLVKVLISTRPALKAIVAWAEGQMTKGDERNRIPMVNFFEKLSKIDKVQGPGP